MSTKIKIDPITRIEGHMAIEAVVDDGVVKEASSAGTLFRGFEIILQGRDPRDANRLTQRICGVCPTAHATASALCLDDAFGLTDKIPDNGKLIRALIFGANFLQSHVLHFYHLAALDYINTTGVGQMDSSFAPSPEKAKAGDVVIVSGSIGRHGIAVMAKREGLEFDVEVESDAATLWPLVDLMQQNVGEGVHVLRDPTRGGLASALNEVAKTAGVGIVLTENSLPIPEPVLAACEMLGFDPLYVANEGTLIAIVDEHTATETVKTLQSHPLGAGAAVIGRVVNTNPGVVALKTSVGGTRVVDMLPGDQLPRIC